MTKILVVTGSVRPDSVNSKIVPVVVKIVKDRGGIVSIADLSELNLPFLNSEVPPSNEKFIIKDESVKKWTQLVRKADGIILVVPEYNHTMTPVQLNAVDWISKEWKDKPIGIVSYGWNTGGARAAMTATEALGEVLKAKVGHNQANLFFKKDIDPDGSIIESAEVNSKILGTVNELMKASS